MRQGFAKEEVWHIDLVLVALVGVREDVGTLKGLWTVAEDVVDDENSGGSA